MKLFFAGFFLTVAWLMLGGASDFSAAMGGAEFESGAVTVRPSPTPPAVLEHQILGDDYNKAEAALKQAISGKKVKIVQLGLKARSLDLKIKAAEALAKLNDKSSVPALVEALSQNQGIIGGGTETQVLQQDLNQAIILALAKLTKLEFKVSRRMANKRFDTHAPIFSTFESDEIEDVLDKTRKWLTSQRKNR